MDDTPRQRRLNRTSPNAAVYYVILAALIFAVTAQIGIPQSLAEPDARRSLAPLSASREARNTEGISRLLGNSTHGKYTISAAEQRKADEPGDLALTDDVVTAPPVPARSSRGFSPRLQARGLQDFELEDIVLLATVDGSIHACDRKTGREKWSLDFPNNPMIDTINYPRNRSSEDDATFDDRDEYIFIVEPSRGGKGNVYVQNRDPSKGGLQKLGVTVQYLAQTRPQYIPGTAFSTIASQQSSLYTVDAASGSILRRSDINDPFMNIDPDRSCPRVDPFSGDTQECDPIGTFILGRMDYTIVISDTQTSEIMCTIRYAEWTINARDTELQIQHDASPLERRQIFSFSNGQIMGMESVDEYGGPRFRAKFDFPVTQVFDVARPIGTKGTSTSLVILSQPIVLPRDSKSLELFQGIPRDRSKVFVNKTTKGSYFLMSEEQFPFSTSTGRWSRLSLGIDTERTEIDLDSEDDDMTGIHRLIQSSDYTRLLDAPPSYEPVKDLAPTQDRGLLPITSSNLGVPNSRPIYMAAVVVLATITWFAVNLYRKGELAVTIQALIEKWTGYRFEIFKTKRDILLNHAAGGEPMSARMDQHIPEASIEKVEELPEEGSENDPAPRSRGHGVAAAPENRHSRQDSRKASSDEEFLESQKVSTETSLEDTEPMAADTLEGAVDLAQDEETPTGRKNRTRPRKRGGVKNNKKKTKALEDTIENVAQMLEKEATPIPGPVQPVSLDGQAATPDPAFVPELQLESGMTQVGVIEVDTRIVNRLGDGSNGTMVFRGTFGLRDVAVKRLVRSPKNFAAAEIKHLPDLDSHPNVVRFFCVQESQNFTWIALDLFTTSLDRIVEKPEEHRTLVPTAGLDVNDVLCQVARGVEHLHSRRVVHRDIKPQNVLVRLLKPNQQPLAGRPNLQVVLSDFGLCKTLDDGPGSAFALTGNHTAAGTTGWKAPELLASGPSAVITVDAGSSGASNPTSTSSEVDGLPGPKLRRPGKSIDIFSLGCLFFYVMTQGGHPFDHGASGSYARDFNIKENKSNTHDLLSFHNYTYEADDLILQMISHEPQNRPTATQVLQHPYFWPIERKLQFLCDVSDCYEREKVAQVEKDLRIKASDESRMKVSLQSEESRTKTLSSSEELDALEAKRSNVWMGSDFLKRLPPRFITEAGKQRKYTGSRMIDLLRLIRNKKNHFHDLPDEIKFGEMDGTLDGYYRFWSARFPSLLVNMHCLIIERGLKDNPEFMELRKYFD